MALIACPECAQDVSDKAPACPRCGHPLAVSAEAKTGTPRIETGNVEVVNRPTAMETGSKPQFSWSGCFSGLLDPMLVAAGVLGIGYRLFWTMNFLWLASCCTCGGALVPPGKEGVGFFDAWSFTGEMFDVAGDDYGKILSFGCWRWVTWACLGLIVVGAVRAYLRYAKR